MFCPSLFRSFHPRFYFPCNGSFTALASAIHFRSHFKFFHKDFWRPSDTHSSGSHNLARFTTVAKMGKDQTRIHKTWELVVSAYFIGMLPFS